MGTFFWGAATGLFCPRLMICRGAPPIEFGSGIGLAVDGVPADTGAGARDAFSLLIGVAFLSESPEAAGFVTGVCCALGKEGMSIVALTGVHVRLVAGRIGDFLGSAADAFL